MIVRRETHQILSMPFAQTKASLGVSVGLAIGTVCGLSSVYLYLDYRENLALAERQLADIAGSTKAFVEQALASADLALQAVDESAATDDVSIGTNPVELHDILRRVQKSSPGMAGLGLLDSFGRLVGSAQTLVPRQINLSDREYFIYHAENPAGGMFIGRPVVSRPDNELSIPVSRRISTLRGGFQGILAARLEMARFEQFFRASGADVVAMVRTDGTLLVRHPALTELHAPALPGSSSLLVMAASQSQGTFLSTSPLDGTKRMVSFQILPTATPLIVAASYDNATITGRWWRRVTPFLVVMGAIVALLSALALQAYRQLLIWEQLIAAQNQARQNAEMAARVADDARQEAENIHHRKTEFLAHMSHEIRTPLNAIIGFAEMIEKQFVGDRIARYQEYAGDIRFSAQHLLSVINEVLDLSKLEAGMWRLQEERFALRALTLDVIRLARGRAAPAGVELKVHMPKMEVYLTGDERVLRQALLNLTVNAIKHAGTDRCVEVNCELEADGRVDISIVDRGVGMTPRQAELALRPFESASDEARMKEGTGLGLPLARAFIELHGGTLTLITAPNKGLRAQILLPADRVST